MSTLITLVLSLTIVALIFGLAPWWMPPFERPMRAYMEWLDRKMK